RGFSAARRGQLVKQMRIKTKMAFGAVLSTGVASMGLAPLAVAAALLPGACTLTRPIPADVRVPPELLRGPGYTAGGEPLRSRYVVRMTDGQRDWEIQLPEIATAYEVKVPLSGKPSPRLAVDSATMTAADREILQDREAAARAESGELDPPARGPEGDGLRPAGGRQRGAGRDDRVATPTDK